MNFEFAISYRLWTTSEHSSLDNKTVVAVHAEETQHIHEDCGSKHVHMKCFFEDFKYDHWAVISFDILWFCIFWNHKETSMQGQDLLDEVSKTHEAIK